MSSTPVITNLKMDGRDLIVHSYQDVEDIIEQNKREQTGEKQKGDFRKIATIPNNVLAQWLADEWARGNVDMKLFDEQFNALVKRKLNDHDWLFLRTDAK
jgi:hypothetical protein